VSHLPPEIRGHVGTEIPTVRSASATMTDAFFPMTLRDVERVQIERTLEQTNGNKSRAAAILGISRQTLREKLKSFQGAPETARDG
jgi:DNA-binding NtrC family response regulator